TVDVVEHEHLAIRVGNLGERRSHQPTGLAVERGIERRRYRISYLERGDLAPLASRGTSPPSAGEAARDARDPGPDARRIAQPRQVAPCLDERLLRDVLGLRDVACTAERDAEHEALVLLDQLGERTHLAGQAAPDQLVVVRFGGSRAHRSRSWLPPHPKR